jgi:SAM-dependent methyltransferase
VRADRERAFYDAEAGELRATELPPPPLDEYDRALLDALGPVDGLEVLEVGCGRGDLSLELVARGARLTAIDVSPAMLDLARRRAERFASGAEPRFLVAPVERTGLPDAAFDRVVGKWVLHHADVRLAAPELARVLRPEGRGAFFENHGRNALLRAARWGLWRLPAPLRVGTLDERPLDHDDFSALAECFGSVALDYPSLYLFEALSRALGHRAHRPLRSLDTAIWRRVPRLRPYGWHVLVTLERPMIS